LKFKHGNLAIANYYAYNNEFSKKPTGFLNNSNLKLKTSSHNPSIKKINENHYQLILSGACKNNDKDKARANVIKKRLENELKHKITLSIKYKKNSMERSKIPEELLIDIFNQFKISNPNNNLHFKEIKLTPYSKQSLTVKEMVKKEII